MNKKGASIKSYIILILILLIALIFIFYLLVSEKSSRKAKPMTENKQSETTTINKDDQTTTTTLVIDNNTENTTPINVEEVSNFGAPLSEIIKSLDLYGDYNITTYYHGVEFDFKCTKYDEEQYTCTQGSALMKINDALYPLFTYSNESDNFLLRASDFYILLNDELVLFVTNSLETKDGIIRIFDRNGVSKGTLKNTLISYVYEDYFLDNLYPNIQDNKIYYYACENNNVLIKYADLGNYSNTHILQRVEGTCY